MIDSNGNSHKALHAELGSRSGVLGASLYEAQTDIAYAASLTFKNVPQEINKAQLLIISSKLGAVNLETKFRNISFSE
jgi:hypothetical protein